MSGWESAKEKFVEIQYTTDAKFWVRLFQDKPDALHALLYDVYAITKAQEEGKGKGRRARNMDGNLDELWEYIDGRRKQ